MPPVLPPAAALAEDVIQNLNRGRSASQAKQSLTALVEARQLGVPSLEVHSRRHLTERLLEWLTSNPREHQSPETAEREWSSRQRSAESLQMLIAEQCIAVMLSDASRRQSAS